VGEWVGSNKCLEISQVSCPSLAQELLPVHQARGAPALFYYCRLPRPGPPTVILGPGPDEVETRPTFTAGAPRFLYVGGICDLLARRLSGALVVFATGVLQYWCTDGIICSYSPFPSSE
jgi:hypothetical protein